MKKDIDYYKAISLSDKDVLKLVEEKATIVTYPELHKYKTLDEVLEPHGAIFLLYETKPDYGHWCCLFKRTDKMIEFFDPYGKFPDTELEWIPNRFRKLSNQMYPHLTALLYASKYNLTYNNHKFQKHGKGINTCGRWSALRLIFRDMSLKDFFDLFYHAKSDDIATILTSIDLNY